MSDGKGPTVSLFKIKDTDQCVGGFTSSQWTSPQTRTYVTDSTAMLFNLTARKLFKSKKYEWAIACGKYYGPCFGDNELLASEPFNGNDKCCSRVNMIGYNIDGYKMQYMSPSMTNQLINRNSDLQGRAFFTIIDLEVWEVIFEK